MKKQYNTKRLTDELSKSVFFQDPEPPDNSTTEQNQVQENSPQAAGAPKHHSRLLTKQQTAQSGRQQHEKARKQQSNRAPHHQNTKEPKNESTKKPSNQSAQQTKQESTKAGSDQSTQAGSNCVAKAPKLHAAKPLKHFSSYLAPGTYKAWKLLATEREKKDYEVLQEAVEQYVAQEHERETKRH